MNNLVLAFFITSLCFGKVVCQVRCDVFLGFDYEVSWITISPDSAKCVIPIGSNIPYQITNSTDFNFFSLQCDGLGIVNTELNRVGCNCIFDDLLNKTSLFCNGFTLIDSVNTVNRSVVGIISGVVIFFILILVTLLGVALCIILCLVYLRKKKSGNVSCELLQESLALKTVNSSIVTMNPYPVLESLYAEVKFSDYDYLEAEADYFSPYDAYDSHVDELYEKIRRTKPVNTNEGFCETIEDQISHIRSNTCCTNTSGTVSYIVVPTNEQRKTQNFTDYVDTSIDYVKSENGDYSEPADNVGEIYNQMSEQKLFEINKDTITILERLGSGEFGEVSKGMWASPVGDLNVALKVVNKGIDIQSQTAFLQEAAILGQFSHPNILRLVGVVTLTAPNMIVTELMHGELRHFLVALQTQHGQELDYQIVAPHFLSFSRQVANGMQHLAERGCIHRDIAARNILLTDRCVCKIADFGMSRRLEAETDYYRVKGSNKLPVKWSAPEAVFFKRYTLKSDVWSYGMLLYEIWSVGRKPWPYEDNRSTVEKMARGVNLPPPAGCSRAVYEIMVTSWHPKADQRPDMKHLVTLLKESDDILLDRGQMVSTAPAFMLGAEPMAAEELYKDLQNRHLMVKTSV